uniref:Uncharacterized protein n=1 Tax=Trichuris muris TaxID=70415 RepID=A0A5S6QTE7_TRIMR
MAALTRYKIAEGRLNGSQERRRGRPQTRDPKKIMDEALKASAVVEHSVRCPLDLRPKIVCHEEQFHLRWIKEAFYIRSNHSINRDKGVQWQHRSNTPSRVLIQQLIFKALRQPCRHKPRTESRSQIG